uniref:Uncharacterized protein n=1 Tax=Cucumis melo TaxID=3656 RepID=A0A9I9E3W6_CUCME
FYPRTRKLSPGHSRSRFLGTSTGSPRAQTVLGRTTVLPPTSSLPDLYLRKTCQGACQECGL